MSDNYDNSKAKSSSSLNLINKVKESEDNKINLEVTNEGMEYLNQLNSNKIGIISVIGPSQSEKTYFSNLIIGEKTAFDNSKPTIGINMWGQPIAHGENTDLLVLDTEGLYKPSNNNTSYDKQTFTLSCLLSSIMVYNTEESINECINKFTFLAKESLSSLKKIEGKELTSSDLPLVYFILHNENIDSNTANHQFRYSVKENPIFTNYFQNFKICVLKKVGDIEKEMNNYPKSKTIMGLKIGSISGSLDEQDYKQKAKLIKDQIMNDLEPKKINNCNLDGKCLFGLFQSFVDLLNKGENIILFNQFNNVLAQCLSDVESQVNFSFTLDKLNEKLKSNTSYEETFLKIYKVTFSELIDEQIDKFKSIPIVKISPSPNVINGIKSIFRKILDTLCENIQSTIDEKSAIIKEVSKIEFNSRLEEYNIEKLLNGFTCFIYDKIISPLFEPNEKKIQNYDTILQVLKSKICGTIEKISPIIQGKINSLIDSNTKIKSEHKKFINYHFQIIEQKNDEITELKIKLEQREREIDEKKLEMKKAVNAEIEKYNILEEKTKAEIAEKNATINELTKISKSLSHIPSSVKDVQINQLELLKNDYHYITNIYVNYKTLVDKLINDKDFFFEDILINKTLSDLRNKYPDIFNLLSEKESLEDMKKLYEKKMEMFVNENLNLKNKIDSQIVEINELKEKIERLKKKLEDTTRVAESKENITNNLKAYCDALQNQIKERDLTIKFKDKQIITNDTLNKEKEEGIMRKETFFSKEVQALYEVIESMFCKNKSKFELGFFKLSTQAQKNLNNWATTYKFKWG
jgi:hypothetical protein